jgi:hypothetical protein
MLYVAKLSIWQPHPTRELRRKRVIRPAQVPSEPVEMTMFDFWPNGVYVTSSPPWWHYTASTLFRSEAVGANTSLSRDTRCSYIKATAKFGFHYQISYFLP